MKNSFGTRLKAILENKGMTQSDLCKLTGIHKSSISLYCADQNVPNNKNMTRIAKALDIDANVLLGTRFTSVVSHAELNNDKMSERASKTRKVARLLNTLSDKQLDDVIDYIKYKASTT